MPQERLSKLQLRKGKLCEVLCGEAKVAGVQQYGC